MDASRKRALRLLRPDHRYRRVRVATLALSFAVLLAVPLLGLARLDLLGGEHLALRRSTDGLGGAVAIAIAAFAFYLVTFALNAFLGRVFCGWGCPLAAASRASDAVDTARVFRRAPARFALAGYALTLSTAALPWWASARGLATAPGLALVGWIGGAAAIWLFARSWRWQFCRTVCPIGLYYSVVQTSHRFGIQFSRDACTDCDACLRICPVALDPRALSTPPDARALPPRNSCLVCGDCVRACEAVSKKRAAPALRLGR